MEEGSTKASPSSENSQASQMEIDPSSLSLKLRHRIKETEELHSLSYGGNHMLISCTKTGLKVFDTIFGDELTNLQEKTSKLQKRCNSF